MSSRGVSLGDGVGSSDVVPDSGVGVMVALDVSGSCPNISETLIQKKQKGK